MPKLIKIGGILLNPEAIAFVQPRHGRDNAVILHFVAGASHVFQPPLADELSAYLDTIIEAAPAPAPAPASQAADSAAAPATPASAPAPSGPAS